MKDEKLINLTKFIILYSQSKGMPVTFLKLQKLLYYIQSWHIVYFDKDPLFNELPEAWVNGPVYRSVYDTYKSKFFRNSIITYNYGSDKLFSELKDSLTKLKLTKKQEKLLYAVLDNYCFMPDEKLVFLTHKEGPWNFARKGLSPIERSNQLIDVDTIYKYYSQRLVK